MAPDHVPIDIPSELLWTLLKQSSDGIALTSTDARVIRWHNDAFQAAFGPSGELVGTPAREVLSDLAIRPPDPAHAIDVQWIEGPSVAAVIVRRPGPATTETSHDPLTGLPDRRQLEQRLNRLWGQSPLAEKPSLAALFIDLNDFKRINDQGGHQTGDVALRQVAQRLQTALRADDFLARYGGDEFVALLAGWKRPDDLERVVRRLHESLEVPLQLDCGSIVVSASIGVACRADHTSPEALLHAADLAMYATKAAR